MATQYISTKSTVFHPEAETDSQEFVLIFGDEVEPTGREHTTSDGIDRKEVVYRGRLGWVRSDRLTPDHPLEMYFIDVGQGDSIFMVTPGGKKILVDGGRGNEAFQFLVWKYRLDLPDTIAMEIDLLVVSHTDEDHVNGLVAIVEHDKIEVKKIIHSGIAKYASGFDTKLGNTIVANGHTYLQTRHSDLAELDGTVSASGQALTDTLQRWRDAIAAEQLAHPSFTYRSVVKGDSLDAEVGDDKVKFAVLGPFLETIANAPAYRWFGSDRVTVNAHSVMLRLDIGDVRVLLSGDINEEGAEYLKDQFGIGQLETDFNAHIFKAPHHGSHHFDRDFLQAVNPQISVVSSGESPDHGHPRANFLGTIGQVSRSDEPLLFSTELVAQFAVDKDAEASDADADVDPLDAAMLGQARRRFKKRLNGIINVRTDGKRIYCARRVAAGYQFVTYKVKPVDGI